MKTHSNEPINSIPDLNNHPSDWYGLTKREYFAAMAMQGIISNPNNHYVTSYSIAERAVQIADALIEQLNKQP